MTHPLAPLLAWRQWIVVRLQSLANGKTDKLPIDSATTRPADAHDPAIWLDYNTAAAYASALPSHTVGFVLTAADPFFCLDIDSALQPDGTWSPLSQALCAALPGCAVEVSQSGRGLHIWGQGVVPEHGKKRVDLGIELYTERRFIALGSNAVGDMSQPCAAIAAVAAHYFPPRAAGVAVAEEGPCAEWRGPTDDDDLLRRALQSRSAAGVFGGRASFADLWHADAAVLARVYPPDASSSDPYDGSSADMALAAHLAFWTGRDVARIERLMRRSKLVREKWDQRGDYLVERTIRGACGMCREVLQDKPKAEPARGGSGVDETVTDQDPMHAARTFIAHVYAHEGHATLREYQGKLYRWAGAGWSEATEVDVEKAMYDFLQYRLIGGVKPNRTRVANVYHALTRMVHIDSSVTAPAWIEGDADAPAAEIVACTNGMLHLPTGELLPATPRFFNTAAVQCDYLPNAAAPQWLAFLRTVWPNDPQQVDTLQEVFGYLLTADTSMQKAFILIGPRRSGKGTIGALLTDLLGVESVTSPSLGSLSGEFGLQPLLNKLVAIVSDARLGGRADQQTIAENLLRISGEDRVDVNRKNLAVVTARLGVRFLFLTNELPKIADASGALASRFIILRMTESFFGREDRTLKARLQRELPGVLAWAVAGWRRLQQRGHFVQPDASAGDVEQLADLGSPVAAFIRDECTTGPTASVERAVLFDAWRVYCSRNGIVHAGSAETLGRDLKAAVPSLETVRPRGDGHTRQRMYRGLALRGPVQAGPWTSASQ